jgi:hypothetical protein
MMYRRNRRPRMKTLMRLKDSVGDVVVDGRNELQ